MAPSLAVLDVTQLSERLLDLVFRALDHGKASIADGDRLAPFVIAETVGGERRIDGFVGDDLETAQATARERIPQLADGAERVALAYDGYVTIDGVRSDAILVEAQERGKTGSVIFVQRYERGSPLRKLQPTCNAAFLGDGEPLF